MINLFAATVGAGLLSLPLIFSYYGLLLGTLCLLMFSLMTYHIITMLNGLIVESGKKSYANLCAHYLGRVASTNQTFAKFIIQFLIFSFLCTCVLYAAVSI